MAYPFFISNELMIFQNPYKFLSISFTLLYFNTFEKNNFKDFEVIKIFKFRDYKKLNIKKL